MGYRLDLPGNEDITIIVDFTRKIWRTTHWGWGRIAKRWGGVIETVIVPRAKDVTIEVNGSPQKVTQFYFTTNVRCFNGAGPFGFAVRAQLALLNAFAAPPRFPLITAENFRLPAFVLSDALIANMPNNRGGDFAFSDRPNNQIDIPTQTAGKWSLVP